MKTFIVTFHVNYKPKVMVINAVNWKELTTTIESIVKEGYVVQELDTSKEGLVFYE